MRYILYVIVVFIALVYTLNLAKAHDWYDRSCFSAYDCRKANPGEITTDSTGYRTHGEHIPFGDDRVKMSKDSNNHICIPSFTNKVRCIYIAMGV